jgi:hypothetical protein
VKVRPVSLLMPTLGAIVRGRCMHLRRVACGALGQVEPGDLLWIREAFYLDARFDQASPTLALKLNAWPVFERDYWPKITTGGAIERPGIPKPRGLGKRRPAGALKKEWHRSHLVVQAVERQRLHAITDAEIRAAGYATRAAFAGDWSRYTAAGMFGRAGTAWADNPTVAVFTIGYVDAPAPVHEQPPKERDEAKRLSDLRQAQEASRLARAAGATRGQRIARERIPA